MILAFANAATKNPRFDSALDRTFEDWKVLRSSLGAIKLDGRFNTLGFVISDRPLNFFKVVQNSDDEIYQVVVGYDLNADFPRDEDSKVISLMASWLRRVFQETDGYAAKRAELLGMVNSWEEQTIQRISSEPTVKA